MAKENKLIPKEQLADFLAQKQLLTKTIHVPAWDRNVEIRELTAREQMQVGALMVNMQTSNGQSAMANIQKDKIGEMLLLASAYGLGIGEDGIELLNNHGAAVARIGQAVLELSGMEGGDTQAPPLAQNGK